MEYRVNDTTITYDARGEKQWGEESVLLNDAIDLSAHTPWHETGFTIEELFVPSAYTVFSDNTRSLLQRLWTEAGLSIAENFPLDQYHTRTNDFSAHLAAVEKTKLLPVSDFPIPIETLEQRISGICKIPLHVKNPFDGQSVFHFRVIRPNSRDNNPLHRDVWLEDYDDCINLYIPIAGSNERSSLILLPGSHRWPESRIERTASGAEINGVRFNVPAVTAIKGTYEVARPNPALNEVLVFSPYLIHGGAVNLNDRLTRISLEIRLWKR